MMWHSAKLLIVTMLLHYVYGDAVWLQLRKIDEAFRVAVSSRTQKIVVEKNLCLGAGTNSSDAWLTLTELHNGMNLTRNWTSRKPECSTSFTTMEIGNLTMDLEFFENRTQINASIRCKEGVDGIIRYRITNGTQASPTIDKHSISLKFKIIKDTGWNTWESVDFLGGVAQNVENKETINGSFICVPAPNPTTTSTASTTTAVLPVTTSKASSTTSPIVSSTTQRGPDSTSAGSSNGSDDSSSTNKEGNNQTIIIVCAVVGGMILITLVVVLIYYLRRRRQKALTSKPPQPMTDQYCTSEGEDENNYNVLHERVRPVKDDIYNEIYELSTDPRLDPRLVNDKSYKSEGTKPTENSTYNVLRERVRPPQGNYNTINYSIMPGSAGEEMDGSIYDECLDNTDQTYNVLRERVGPTPENYSTVSDSKPDDNPESYTYSEVDRDYLRERRQAQPRVDMVDNDLYEGCSDEYANV